MGALRRCCPDYLASAFSIESSATAGLWQEDLSYPDLAEDIAVEARLALSVTEEIHELNERIQVLVHDLDPHAIITSAPGIGPVTGAVILGRLGDISRFHSLAAVRAYTGLVPRGINGRHGGRPNAATPCYTSPCSWPQNQARRHDPTRTGKYHCLRSSPVSTTPWPPATSPC